MNESCPTNSANASQDQTNIILNLTNGGRSLNAIWNLPFKSNEKLILQYFGSQLDFTGDFLEWRKVSHSKIAEKTGLSRRTVIRTMLGLETKGYLRSCSNRKEANHYHLTDKIFRRYSQWLMAIEKKRQNEQSKKTSCDCQSLAKKTSCDTESQGCDTESQGGVTESHTTTPYNAPSNAPSKVNIRTDKPIKYTEEEYNIAKSHGDWVKEHHPRVKVNLDKWADEVRLIKKEYQWTDEMMAYVLQWIRDDDFWSNQCLSILGLRTRRNGVSKMDRVRSILKKKSRR